MTQKMSDGLRRDTFIAGTIGHASRIGKTSKTYRSDAADVDFALFDKMMTGSNPSLKTTRNQKTIRNFRDKVRVKHTGATVWEQFFSGQYEFEFYTRRGEFLGGMRHILADVTKEIWVDKANPPRVKLSEGALRCKVLQDQPDLTGESLKAACARELAPKNPQWVKKKISLEKVSIDKWGKAGTYNIGPLRMFFAAQVRDDMKQRCVEAYNTLKTKAARKASKAERHN